MSLAAAVAAQSACSRRCDSTFLPSVSLTLSLATAVGAEHRCQLAARVAAKRCLNIEIAASTRASLQLDAREGRVERIEYCQRFADASDRIVSAGEAILMVPEIVPLLRHAVEPERAPKQ